MNTQLPLTLPGTLSTARQVLPVDHRVISSSGVGCLALPGNVADRRTDGLLGVLRNLLP